MSNSNKGRDLPTSPDQMFCFAVYSASHVINRAYAPHLKALGLTYPQYIALTFLWQSDGQSVGALSKQMRMETSTLTPLLKRLEGLGHIRRERGLDDERQVFVHLTKTGAALKRKAPEITACMVDATGFELEALDALVASLNELRDTLGTA